MSDPTPLEVLGLPPGATDAEVTAAYRKLARRHHPDQHPSDTPEQRRRREARMAEINAAHQQLLDGWKPSTPRPRPPRTAPPTYSRPRVPPPPPPRPASSTPPPTAPPEGEPVSAWRVFAVIGFALAAVVVAVAVIVAVISPETEPSPTEDQPLLVDVGSWTVGTCVSSGPRAEAVRCEFPNRGMVVAEVFSADRCPAAADAYVADPPRLLCIDFDA